MGTDCLRGVIRAGGQPKSLGKSSPGIGERNLPHEGCECCRIATHHGGELGDLAITPSAEGDYGKDDHRQRHVACMKQGVELLIIPDPPLPGRNSCCGRTSIAKSPTNRTAVRRGIVRKANSQDETQLQLVKSCGRYLPAQRHLLDSAERIALCLVKIAGLL